MQQQESDFDVSAGSSKDCYSGYELGYFPFLKRCPGQLPYPLFISVEVNVKTNLRRSFALVATLLLILATSVPAFSQGLFATVTGTVTDGTKALIPGVAIKATAVDTGVVTTTLSNEAGTYTFGNLAAGKY